MMYLPAWQELKLEVYMTGIYKDGTWSSLCLWLAVPVLCFARCEDLWFSQCANASSADSLSCHDATTSVCAREKGEGHPSSPAAHHKFGDIGTVQASLHFASIGFVLILMRDCKGRKESRMGHASTSPATAGATQPVWTSRHTGYTDIPRSCCGTVSGSLQHTDIARFTGIIKFRCGTNKLFINWNS